MRLVFTLALASSLAGCWNLPADDAGDAAFVSWSTTTLLGRRPLSQHEQAVLVDLTRRHGREALLDVLMEEPEFVEHWQNLLMQELRVSLGVGNSDPEPEACYTKRRLRPSYDYALVNHLRNGDWREPFCVSSASASDELVARTGRRTNGALAEEFTGIDTLTRDASISKDPSSASKWGTTRCMPFTMRDVFRASLRTDHLDALYLARLVPMTATHAPVEARRTLFDSYFNRRHDCMECHSTGYSTTNGVPRNDDWDRYVAPHDLDLEASAFSWIDEDGYHDGSLGGPAVNNRFTNLFAGVRGRATDPGDVQPWGMSSSCIPNGIHSTDDDANPPVAGFGDQVGTDVRIFALYEALGEGMRNLRDGTTQTGPRPGEGGAVTVEAIQYVNTGCLPCHTGPDAPPLFPPVDNAPYVVGEMSHERIRRVILEGSPAGDMAAQPVDPELASEIADYLVAFQPDPLEVYTHPGDGMAHLTATRMVDTIVQQVSGESLTLDHGYPRNADQALVLRELTDDLIANDWSLRYVLKRVMLSEMGNRNAPADSTADPYVLPMLSNPWVDAPPGAASSGPPELSGVGRNGQGDQVHRWPVATLRAKRNAALGFPSQTRFDDPMFATDLGAFENAISRGTDTYDLNTALAWEADVWSGPSPCHDYGDDLIDALVDSSRGLTLRQALQTLKYRLVGEDVFYGEEPSEPGDIGGLANPGGGSAPPAETEAERIASLYGLASLSVLASDHEPVVREYCATLLMSPQFVFDGIDVTSTPPSSAPDPAVPCIDKRCTEQDYCTHYRDAADVLGYAPWSCGDWPLPWASPR